MKKLSVLLILFLLSFVFLSTIKFAYASNVVVAYENFDDDTALRYIVSGAVFTTDNFANHQLKTGASISGFGKYIAIANNTQSNSARYINSTRLTTFLDKNATNEQVLGCWFSPNNSVTSDYAWAWLRWINNADGYYIALTFTYSSGWRVGFSFQDGTGYHTSGTTYSMSDGSWYWIELRYYYNVGTYGLDYYVNGSAQGGGWSGVAVSLTGSQQEIQFGLVGSGSSLRCGWYNMDLIRLANYREFPPTPPPPAEVYVSVASTPINSSIVWTNGSTYTCPQNISANSSSNVVVTTQTTYRENATTIYLFDYWTVNGTQVSDPETITRNVTGNTSLVAVYTSANIPHVEEGWIRIGIGLIGLLLMFLSWFIGYFLHKAGDTAKGGLIWFVMFIIGYGLFTVLLGG